MFYHALIDAVSLDHHHHIHCTGRVPQSWPPKGHKCKESVTKMNWGREHGPMDIWCEFEEDRLKTLLCRANTAENEVGPFVATNVTNQWQQCIGTQIMAERIGDKNELGHGAWTNGYLV